MSVFNMSLLEFYDYTPIEIDYAFKACYENENDSINLSWEQIRLQIYYSYLLTPSDKNKVSYSIFKNDYLHFDFDDEPGQEHKSTEAMDDESINKIQDFFNTNK